ncbi:MAG: hypothetical protein J6J93_02325 [Muribaculaceae bacterium]|nr:hypothetical protein [Muribaculaceae bacterium]
MKYLKYILAISSIAVLWAGRVAACGPYYPDSPGYIKIFRCCSPELESQWQEGRRFHDYEKYENCLLWQKITSPAIPLDDIEKVVYKVKLSELRNPADGELSDNWFAKWLSEPEHRDDLDYLLIAKEIEEIREYMNNPWYYAYDGDEEHVRLNGLMTRCRAYTGKRHAARYALQMVRMHFAKKDFRSCLKLWEESASKMQEDIVADIIASYVGGAYLRCGNREKAIELFTRSGDIGSLMSMKAWDEFEEKSEYTDMRVKQLEYIFNRFADSPLLSIKLQEYVREREKFVYHYEDSSLSNEERIFYGELKRFAKKAVASPRCHQKGMWRYVLGFLYYLDGNMGMASAYLKQAECSQVTPLLKESTRAFRFLMNGVYANNSAEYRSKLLCDLKWLDERMKEGTELNADDNWEYNNWMNWSVNYWQDVARKVLLGEVCPRMERAGNTTLALQLANYASNRIHQVAPMYEVYRYDSKEGESYTEVISFDDYRKTWEGFNYYDYSNQFFDRIYDSTADKAARYAERIEHPKSELDKYLNDRSYADTDYIYDIVGTLYLREMNYEKASHWLAKVSTDYQARTNIAKEGYFKLGPFRYQFDKEHFIADSSDYKLRFAQEMVRLDKMMHSDAEANRKADAKIRYGIGLRNSFGRCWYLTSYGFNSGYDEKTGDWLYSINRESFMWNAYARSAYKKVDVLMQEAVAEFTDPEKAAQAQLEMMNYATLIKKYPETKAAQQVKSRCDNYYDYGLEVR